MKFLPHIWSLGSQLWKLGKKSFYSVNSTQENDRIPGCLIDKTQTKIYFCK